MKMKAVLVGTYCLFVLVSATNISEQCRVHNETEITCSCIGSEDFILPEEYNYLNVTSLRVHSCASVNLHFSSLAEAGQIREIVVQDITERLNFELFLTTRKMKKIELSRIRRIPLITHDTFTSLESIEDLIIENVLVENFEETFADIVVSNFYMNNVTIERMDGVNFSEKGRMLQLSQCKLENVTGSLNFAHFTAVHIHDSIFELQKPGHLHIMGDVVLVENSIFSNASMNVVAATTIKMNSTCADGKSSLRISSNRIESLNNKLPTQIVYVGDQQSRSSGLLTNKNNEVCKAGICNCNHRHSKSNGQSGNRPFIELYALEFLLLSLSVFLYGK